MEFGFFLPQGEQADLRRDVPLVAREAERFGYASLWVYERELFPLEPADGMYGIPGVPWTEKYRFTAEPLTVLTVAAAVTETIRLGTSVLVAPFHPAHHLARTIATLDQVSGGRVVLGLGGGWSTDEFRALGADFSHRGRTLEETIDACRALWGPDPVSYRDSRMVVANALVTPKPVATIPILLGGGNTEAALDRIARRADGWLPTALPVGVLRDRWHTIRDLAAGHGRNADAMRLVPLVRVLLRDTDAGADRLPFQGSVAQIVADMTEYAEAGVDEAMITVGGAETGKEMVAKADRLMTAFAEAGLGD